MKKDAEKIRIRQDSVGSYGIYLYRDGEYFAISNSFIMLVDHVKRAHRITLNQDYANSFLTVDLCSVAFSETMVNEIEVLDRCASIEIEIATKRLAISYFDYKGKTVELDSSEGFRILDQWYSKWTSLFKKLEANQASVQIDLSGGFDSRLNLLLALGANINLNKIYVCSAHDKLHTHTEDYEIASQISDYFGFELNNRSGLSEESNNYTLDDILSISFFTKLCHNKQMYFCFNGFEKPRYHFGGHGGECIRDYWNKSETAYIEEEIQRTKSMPNSVANACEKSINRMMNTVFEKIRNKFARWGRSVESSEMGMNLYRETRNRNHAGKLIVESYLGGSVLFVPLLDHDLHRLKRNTSSCHDKNLLMAVIFNRYQPDLLNYKFDSNRFIDSVTIEYARDLNEKVPVRFRVPGGVRALMFQGFTRHRERKGELGDEKYPYIPGENAVSTNATDVVRFDNSVSVAQNKNPRISTAEVNKVIEKVFWSPRVKEAFEQVYGAKYFYHLYGDTRKRKYFPLQNMLGVIAVSKIAQDVLANEIMFDATTVELLQKPMNGLRSCESGVTLNNHPYLDNYIMARIDIKNNGSCENELEFIHVSDLSAKITKPK